MFSCETKNIPSPCGITRLFTLSLVESWHEENLLKNVQEFCIVQQSLTFPFYSVSTKRPRVNSAYSNTDHVHSKMEFLCEHPYYASFYNTTDCLFVRLFWVCVWGGGVLCCSFITYCKTIISEELLYTDVIPIVNCNLIVTDFGII